MIWKLTDKIWWGDMSSPREAAGQVKAVLCVADNLGAEEYNPVGTLPPLTPYFRMAWPDGVPASGEWIQALHSLIVTADAADWFPLLIHCRAGQHRAPNTAIYTATLLDYCDAVAFNRNRLRALELRPDICWLEFGQSMDRECRKMCNLPLPHYDRLK